MARVLITGASGFIGSHLTRACLARGDAVAILTRPESSLERLGSDIAGVATFRCDYSDTASLRSCFDTFGPEIVFHTAARTRFPQADDLSDLDQSIDENLKSLTALVRVAATCKRPPRVFVRTGSIAEYGAISLPYVETARENPGTAYGASILAGTRFLEMAAPRLPFQAVTARLALTYGPQQSKDFLIPQVVGQLLRQQAVHIHRPHDRRDLIHVHDVVQGLIMIASNPEKVDPVINLATGYAPDMAEVARLLVSLIDVPGDLVNCDTPDSDPVVLLADATRMKTLFGWTPGISLSDGLERTVQWEKQSRDCKITTGTRA